MSKIVFTDTLPVPALPVDLAVAWQREAQLGLGLAPGDIEPLPLSRMRRHWRDYRRAVKAVHDWAGAMGWSEPFSDADVALMASRGTRYHHDGEHYGDMAFCNLFLSGDGDADLHFPLTDHRVSLLRGTVVVFDTGQPHAIVRHGARAFEAGHFAQPTVPPQFFLSWELPIEHVALARALDIAFDVDPDNAADLEVDQVWLDGKPIDMCPVTGRPRECGSTQAGSSAGRQG